MKHSIVTITYNRAYIIEETIESVLNQTYNNWEYIIVDDGSTDNTEELVEAYKAVHQNITYIKKEKIGVLSILWNIGLKAASGDYVTILDSDDILDQDKLKECNDYVERHQNVDVLFHNAKFITYKGEIIKTFYKGFPLEGIVDFNTIIKNITPICSSGIMLKTATLKKTTYLDEHVFDGMYNLILHLTLHYNTHYLEKSLLSIRKHNESITSDDRENLGIIELSKFIETIYSQKKITELEYKKIKASMLYNSLYYYYNIKSKKKYTKTIKLFFKNSTFSLKWVKAIIRLLLLK